MRRVPLALAFVPVLLLLTAAPASATSCPLLSDAVHDEKYLTVLRSGSLDLVSADVASGPSTVVVVLRVRSLAEQLDVARLTGLDWTVAWEIGTTSYAASAKTFVSPGFYAWDFTVDGVDAGPVALTVDEANATFTWSIPRSYLPDLAVPGQTFSQVRAISSGFGSLADVALTPSTYVDGDPGCVPAS